MESRKVIRSAGTVGVWIMVSRLFGLLRDMSMAAFFGSSMAMDAFVVAFTIPNLFRSLFGEGALSSAFVPVFTEAHEKEDGKRVWVFAARMFSLLSFTLLALTLLGILLTALGMKFLPLSPRLMMIGQLLMIMLPYMFFICLTAFFSAILNSLRRFALPAAIPVALNLVMLAVLIFVCPRMDPAGAGRIRVVAWSVLAAGLLQAILPLPMLIRRGFRLRLDFDWSDPRVRRVLTLMGAAAIGVGVTQFNVLVDRFIAVWIGPGSPSYLYYAERLIYFPLGIFATAMGTVLLPTLSIHAAQARPDRIRSTLNYALRQILFITLPAALGMLVLAEPIVQAVYQHGDFAAETTRQTALALACYAPGLVVFSLLKVLVPVFYAQQDMRTPVKVGIVSSILNLILNLILMWPLRHAGIAVATVLASTVHVIILALIIQKRAGSPGWVNVARAGIRMLAPLVMMAVAAIMIQRYLPEFFSRAGLTTKPANIFSLAIAIGGGALVYLAVAGICRCREAGELLGAIRRRAE